MSGGMDRDKLEPRGELVASSKPAPLPNTNFADLDLFLQDVFETMRKKGHDYRQGNDNDLLHNFRTVAGSVGTDMEKVWFTYFYKHYSALVTFIKEGGQSESEPIEGRIKDLIVYLVLFYRMIKERKDAKLPRKDKISQILRDAQTNIKEQILSGGNFPTGNGLSD